MIKILNNVFNGKSLVIKGNNIIIDGEDVIVPSDDKIINIVVEGDIPKLEIASCNNLTINGNVENYVELTNGDITCWDVHGNVETVNGDVLAQTIQGNVSTVNGNIRGGRDEN